jgi:peptidoglycan hydrolase FlgJ
MASPVNLSLAPPTLSDVKSVQSNAAQQLKAKDKVVARQFESQFLNSMFQEMFTGVDGDGPAGGSGALKIWRSFMTDQYAKSFAAAGGLGIASHVYNELLKQQGLTAS